MGYSDISSAVIIETAKGLINGRPFGVISVSEFGAKGDGVTNDTIAIQSAINKAYELGGGTVFIPTGVYAVSGITVPNGVSLQGANKGSTEIRLAAEAESNVITLLGNMYTDSTFQTVSSLTINGNKANQTAGGNGIELSDSCTFVRIDDVIVKDCKQNGIYCVSSHRNILTNSYCINNDGAGVKTEPGSVNDSHLEMVNISCMQNYNGFELVAPIDQKSTMLITGYNSNAGLVISNQTAGISQIIGFNSYQDNVGMILEQGGGYHISSVSIEQVVDEGILINSVYGANLSNIYINRPGKRAIVMTNNQRVNLSNITIGAQTQTDVCIDIINDANSPRYPGLVTFCTINGLVVRHSDYPIIRTSAINGATKMAGLVFSNITNHRSGTAPHAIDLAGCNQSVITSSVITGGIENVGTNIKGADLVER